MRLPKLPARILSLSVAALLCLTADHAAQAANIWDGGGTTNNWNDAINWDDEIVKGTALTRDGAVIHPNFAPKSAA
jgi:hypothetical protein